MRGAGPDDLLVALQWLVLKAGGEVRVDCNEVSGTSVVMGAHFEQRPDGTGYDLIVRVQREPLDVKEAN